MFTFMTISKQACSIIIVIPIWHFQPGNFRHSSKLCFVYLFLWTSAVPATVTLGFKPEPKEADWYKTYLSEFLSDLTLVNSHQRATCPGPSVLSSNKLFPRVNYGWWEMKRRKEVTRVLPWIVIDSFLWAFFLLQVIRVGEELVQQLKRSRHRLAFIQSVLSFCHFPPNVQFVGGRGLPSFIISTVSIFILLHVGLLSLSNELFKNQAACSEVKSVNSSIQLSPRNLRKESGSKRKTIKHL